MSAEKIATAYNQITHRWNSDEFDMSNGILQHQKAISFVKNRGKALDVGCGCTGRFIDLLLDEAFMPAGIDISPAMLKIARAKHPDIHFILGDIGQYELSDKYDFITAWDSIWHSPLAEQKSLITKIVASLNIGGVFIFSFGGTDTADSHSNHSMGPELHYSSLGVNGYLALFIELGCVIRHLEFDQYPELHTYLVVEKAE